MSKTVVKEEIRKRTRSWVLRFARFNLIGMFVFFIGTIIFAFVFSYFGPWTWLVANGAGSILQFLLISFFNKKKGGVIFEQCPSTKEAADLSLNTSDIVVDLDPNRSHMRA